MALVSLNSFHVSMAYSLALWGVMYLIVATFAKSINDKHRSCLMTTGHTVLFSAALSIALFGNPTATLHVYLLIGTGYLISYFVKKKEIYRIILAPEDFPKNKMEGNNTTIIYWNKLIDNIPQEEIPDDFSREALQRIKDILKKN